MKINNTKVARMILLAALACEERLKNTPANSPNYEAHKAELEFYEELDELVLEGDWDEIERRLNAENN